MSLESPPQPQTQHQPECQRLYSSCDVTSAARLLRKARHALQHKTSRRPALTGPEPWPTHAPSTAPPPLCAAHHHCTRCLATCLPFTFPTACLPCRMCLTNVQPPPFQCFPRPQDKPDIHPGPQGSHGAATAWLLHSAPSQAPLDMVAGLGTLHTHPSSLVCQDPTAPWVEIPAGPALHPSWTSSRTGEELPAPGTSGEAQTDGGDNTESKRPARPQNNEVVTCSVMAANGSDSRFLPQDALPRETCSLTRGGKGKGGLSVGPRHQKASLSATLSVETRL